MLTPYRTIVMLRAVTLAAVFGLLCLTLGPFQGLETRLGLDDKTAHGVAFYVITLLSFAVAPTRRRTDLALAVLSLGILIELAQGVLGRSLSLGDFLADGVGVAAATAPAWIERFRHLVRRHPYLSYADSAALDRRRDGARRHRPASRPGARTTVSEKGWL